MICDNTIHPLVYEVTKIEDTFPLGSYKVTLKQTHFDKVKDNVELKICNYYDDVPPVDEGDINYSYRLELDGISPIIYIGGSTRTITVETDDTELESVTWSFSLEGSPLTDEEITKYLTYTADGLKLSIQANKIYSLLGKDLTVQAETSTGQLATVTLEVRR